MYFVTIWSKEQDQDGQRVCRTERCITDTQLFELLQELDSGELYAIYKGECVLDKS